MATDLGIMKFTSEPGVTDHEVEIIENSYFYFEDNIFNIIQ